MVLEIAVVRGVLFGEAGRFAKRFNARLRVGNTTGALNTSKNPLNFGPISVLNARLYKRSEERIFFYSVNGSNKMENCEKYTIKNANFTIVPLHSSWSFVRFDLRSELYVVM